MYIKMRVGNFNLVFSWNWNGSGLKGRGIPEPQGGEDMPRKPLNPEE